MADKPAPPAVPPRPEPKVIITRGDDRPRETRG